MLLDSLLNKMTKIKRIVSKPHYKIGQRMYRELRIKTKYTRNRKMTAFALFVVTKAKAVS